MKSDVNQPAEVEKTIRTVIDRFGRIDCACNNAGVEDTAAAFQDQTLENYDKVFGVNVKGLWLCMQHEIRQMTKQGSGAIVNVSSVAGMIGVSKNATYVASKHAVIGFTKAAAVEVSKIGIRVNAVAPAAIDTGMFDRFAANPELRQRVSAAHPIGRIGRPEEVANAVIWLCSDEASFVTGHTLLVDGGYTAQ